VGKENVIGCIIVVIRIRVPGVGVAIGRPGFVFVFVLVGFRFGDRGTVLGAWGRLSRLQKGVFCKVAERSAGRLKHDSSLLLVEFGH
jgi:hypothetical protein